MLKFNELLPGNIVKVQNTCQKYNVGKMYMSAILPSTRTNIIFLTLTKSYVIYV